jgi:DUF2971 family protein
VPVKTHDRDFFFKYMRADSGLTLLTSSTARWSCPLLFNDPFDTRFSVRIGFPPSDLPKALRPRIERLLRGDDPVPDAANRILKASIALGRLTRDKGGLDVLLSGMTEALEQGASNIDSLTQQEAERWQAWLRHVRVFCVSEIHDDLLMWAHYADCHRGVVIKLRCVPEKDNALCAAVPIQYRPDVPSLASSAEEWAAHMCGDARLDHSKLFLTFAMAKSDHWSYEKEWRCLSDRSDGSGPLEQLVDEVEVYAEEIGAVYLGCRIIPEHRAAIVDVVTRSFPDAELFQARPSASYFKLEFERLR